MLADPMPRPRVTPNTDPYGNPYYLSREIVTDNHRRSLRGWALSVVSSTIGTCIGVVVMHFVGVIW